MGSVISTVYHRLLLTIVGGLRLVFSPLDKVARRIGQSPGLPLPDPSQSYWMMPPSPISCHNAGPSVRVPEYSDIVIIGSGITGTSFARTILDWANEHRENPPHVVMLEAREACSGATGRNGGHITPILYPEYGNLKKQHGMKMAKKIIRFRLSHLPELLAVAEEEGLLQDSQCREVEAFDVFYDATLYETAKALLSAYKKDLPVESINYRIYEGVECIKSLQLSPKTAGCCSTRAGAVHPYRLVTGILSRLLKYYPSSFDLYTHTPCIKISPPVSGASPALYQITTPKGTILTPHIIHATNGWISHLLPGMRGKIVPVRGVVTAQRPWRGLGDIPDSPCHPVADSEKPESWTGARSFVFYPGDLMSTYDYLIQQPAAPETIDSECTAYPAPEGELMLGGGFDLTAIGNVDDRSWDPETEKYLSSRLGDYFEGPQAVTSGKRVKQVWSGVESLSVDEKPWVGRIPEKISGRRVSSSRTGAIGDQEPASRGTETSADRLGSGASAKAPATGLAAPGEWMAAGYTGEGMVHAWMSGKALAYMVLGFDVVDDEEKGEGDLVEWFPDVFRVTEERWKNTGIDDRTEDFISLD